MLRSRQFLLFLVALGLVLGGCRTYGGYDTKPKTYQAMQKAVQSFEDEATRAENDLQELQEAAERADTLQVFAENFQGLLDEHQSLLETQRQRIERLSPSSTYRNLQSAYGATVTEQRMMQQKYRRILRRIQTTVQGVTTQASRPKTDRRYTIRPVGFPSLRNSEDLTMDQALRGL